MDSETEHVLKWSPADVVYHIYPRSFKDSNGNGVGDLCGITERLDYLRGQPDSLGVDAIWLSPFYSSPMADFGYDISDYCNVDPLFGSLPDFDDLVEKAHKIGLKVMVDFVPNHTSSQHPWFIDSRSSETAEKRNWYIWQTPKADGSPPNNWQSVFGGSGWELDPKTGQYYFHSFLKEQPDLNWLNPEVAEAMRGVLRFWMDRGVDGFRVDAINWLVKDKQFRNDPINPTYEAGKEDPYRQFMHIYSHAQAETLKILNQLCGTLQEYENKFMVTELHADIAGMQRYYRACPSGQQAPFNFNLIGMPWRAEIYKKFIDDFELSLQPADHPNYVLGNHDQPRVASRLGQDRARLSALLQMTMRGMPFIYYGEEIGMEDTNIPLDLVKDPFEKNVPGFRLGRDPQRTPMQWNPLKYAGFTENMPWLPINENYQHINVETQKKDSRSMLSLYRKLIAFRKKYASLAMGKYEPLPLPSENIFAFYRSSGEEKIFVLLNFSQDSQSLQMENLSGSVMLNSFLDRPEGETVNLSNFILRGYEGFVLKLG